MGISDLFHVLDLASQLLNKEEIHDDDTEPFKIFMKYAVNDKNINQPVVLIKEVPKMLLEIFICRKDAKRIDIANLIDKFSSNAENKHVI